MELNEQIKKYRTEMNLSQEQAATPHIHLEEDKGITAQDGSAMPF